MIKPIYFLRIVSFLICIVPVTAIAGKTVVDRAGRNITVEKPFERIISLYGAHTENLFSLGLDREVIGVSVNDTYPPAVMDKQGFSYHDDAEKFMAARPDLVLVRPMIDRVYQPFVKKLEQAGITVASLQPVGAEDMYRYWQDPGTLTGREEQAREMIHTFQEAVERVRAQVDTIPVSMRKRVYFEAIHGKMKTFAAGSTAMFALETAGGINVADDAEQMRKTNIAAYSKERILAKGREIDVYLAQRGTMNPVTLDHIEDEPGFQQVVKAVRMKEIYLIDEMVIARPTFRLLKGILEIANILYPEVMADPVSVSTYSH